jgi:ABC-type dipeptide/oligopeptide/nickel transport system permease component
VFALEWTSGLGGLGPRTIAALQNGDAPWLMALCLGLAALTAVAHILADGLQKRALGRATS